MADNRIKIDYIENPNANNLNVQNNEYAFAFEQNQRTQSVVALSKRLDIETILPEGGITNHKINTYIDYDGANPYGDLVVELQGLNGSNPSSLVLSSTNIETTVPSVSGNMIYARIKDDIVAITSNLSLTVSAGTNFFNLSSVNLENYKHDLFVYLIKNSGGIRLGVCRAPHYTVVSQASTTTTNDTYLKTSGTVESTDNMINIGRITVKMDTDSRFNYAGESISKPIFESEKRQVISSLSLGGYTSLKTVSYKVINSYCYYTFSHFPDVGANTASIMEVQGLPFQMTDGGSSKVYSTGGCDMTNNSIITTGVYRRSNDNTIQISKTDSGTIGGGITGCQFTTFYEI